MPHDLLQRVRQAAKTGALDVEHPPAEWPVENVERLLLAIDSMDEDGRGQRIPSVEALRMVAKAWLPRLATSL